MNYRNFIRQLIREEARPTHKFGHQVRLWSLTQTIKQDLSYDDDVVFAAVWLHDLGVFDGNRPNDLETLLRWDHVAYAEKRASTILAQTDFPPHKIPPVLQVMREHQPLNEPTSLEATIVRDADILEQLGTVAVLRTAAKLGSDTRFADFSDVVRHLRQQAELLPHLLRLPSSRRLAVSRLASLNSFLTDYEEEAGEALHGISEHCK